MTLPVKGRTFKKPGAGRNQLSLQSRYDNSFHFLYSMAHRRWITLTSRRCRMAMPVVTSPLVVALRRLGPPGVAVGHRIICEGDEEALLPNERLSIGPSAAKVRRQSGAARVAARQLLSAFGLPDAALPRSASGAPVWPSGYVGSLAHDADIAVAAAASIDRFLALGIDVEPAVDLPPNLVDVVTTPAEFAHYPVRIIRSRLLFCNKGGGLQGDQSA
jgi:4'-phosphopantetheinyl transferase EntD